MLPVTLEADLEAKLEQEQASSRLSASIQYAEINLVQQPLIVASLLLKKIL